MLHTISKCDPLTIMQGERTPVGHIAKPKHPTIGPALAPEW
jgi:hypothetical protein